MTPYILLFILFLVSLGATVALRELENEPESIAFDVVVVDNFSPEFDRIIRAMNGLENAVNQMSPVLQETSKSLAAFGQTMRESGLTEWEDYVP